MDKDHDFVSDLYHDFRADVFSRNELCRTCGGLKPKDNGSDICEMCFDTGLFHNNCPVCEKPKDKAREVCQECEKAYQVIGTHIWD